MDDSGVKTPESITPHADGTVQAPAARNRLSKKLCQEPLNNNVQSSLTLIGNVGRLPWHESRETQAGSGAGRHIGGKDVVRVAVEVVAGPVVPHRGAGISVSGGDLHVAQVDATPRPCMVVT